MRVNLLLAVPGALLCLVQQPLAQIVGPVIPVASAPGAQGFPQVAYNSVEDEYLVVWEEYRHEDSTSADIWGQIVRKDGTLRGGNFPICQAPNPQWWPHLDFDKLHNRYLVVFEDARHYPADGSWIKGFDIYGALLDADGKKIPTSTSVADSTFPVCDDTMAAHYPVVAFNEREQSYLVVWADYRPSNDIDIYGQLLDWNGDLLPPPDPPSSKVNFAIANTSAPEDVPDVSYCSALNEWLVVYAAANTGVTAVHGQRVNAAGTLLTRDGLQGVEPIAISSPLSMWPDPVQPRVQFNNEWYAGLSKATIGAHLIEALVLWKREHLGYDLMGLRVAYIPDADAVALGLKPGPASDTTFFAALMDEHGTFGTSPDDEFPISDAPRCQETADLAFSQQDNEFLVAWGDRRAIVEPTGTDQDLYCQRLWVAPDSALVWLNVDRTDTVARDANIPVEIRPLYDGSLVGVAHGSHQNQFFIVYTAAESTSALGGAGVARSMSITGVADPEVLGRLLGGSPPTRICAPPAGPPTRSELWGNCPNPFNPQTKIYFSLAASQPVRVEIFDLTGARVRVLVDGTLGPGRHTVLWRGDDQQSRAVCSGVYLYCVHAGSERLSGKMTLLR